MKLSGALWSVVVPVGFVIFMIFVFSNARFRRAAQYLGVVPEVLVMFLWSLLSGGGILLAGIQMWATAPLVGALVVIAGGIYLAVILPFLIRLYRAVTSAPTADPDALRMSPMLGLWLIGPFASLLWIGSQTAR